MGTIYRGTHRDTDVSVAVKVIRRAGPRAARRPFHVEIQAHAGLQHPGIVYLFEYGSIDGEAAEASEGELRRGDPFVAVELADRGTVRDAMPLGDWPTVCRILVQALDALAYSHARRVIHRDLKPENLLVFDETGDGDADWRVKLADFGVAHAFGGEFDAETDELEAAAGTPLYMSPEQVRGDWREYGPWTDLYALGCIAWEMVCGLPPFSGDNHVEIALNHEMEDRPPARSGISGAGRGGALDARNDGARPDAAFLPGGRCCPSSSPSLQLRRVAPAHDGRRGGLRREDGRRRNDPRLGPAGRGRNPRNHNARVRGRGLTFVVPLDELPKFLLEIAARR